MEQLQTDLKEFILLLNAKKVEYLLIGAHAVGLHGHPRYTADIDFFVRQSAENAERLREVISEFFGYAEVEASDFLKEDSMFRVGVPPNRIELLNKIAGVTYEEAEAGSLDLALDGIPVHVIGLRELIRNKLSTGRSKDAEDAAVLQRRQTETSGES